MMTQFFKYPKTIGTFLGGMGLLLLVTLCLGTESESDIDIEIDVAPKVLNLISSGTVVTVHTDIAYSTVDGASVLLNGVPIDWWKSDSRGYFVAKFVMSAVKDLPLNIGGDNTLTLEGSTDDGEIFMGSKVIKVIEIKPKGGK